MPLLCAAILVWTKHSPCSYGPYILNGGGEGHRQSIIRYTVLYICDKIVTSAVRKNKVGWSDGETSLDKGGQEKSLWGHFSESMLCQQNPKAMQVSALQERDCTGKVPEMGRSLVCLRQPGDWCGRNRERRERTKGIRHIQDQVLGGSVRGGFWSVFPGWWEACCRVFSMTVTARFMFN